MSSVWFWHILLKLSLGSAQKKIFSEEKKSELNNLWGKKWFLSIFKIHKSLTFRRPVKYGAMSEIPLKWKWHQDRMLTKSPKKSK